MKKFISLLMLTLILPAGGCSSVSPQQEASNNEALEQQVYADTVSVSKEYLALRYRTDMILMNAEDYANYDDWNNEMSVLIRDWEKLDENIAGLETSATELAADKTAFHLIDRAYAYDKEEISRIVDSAPFGKKIATLAKHLGVDAKQAQLILNQDQAQVQRDAWGEAGDTFQQLENDAVRLKNGCKVAGFVGTVVLSGGAAAIAEGGAIATTAVVVSGADLTLEIADDEAKIAYGDKNKASELIGNIRTVTEPAAAILTIASMPDNLTKSVDKLGAFIFTTETIRSVAQDEKYLGISLKVDSKGEVKAEISGLSEEELEQWRKDNNAVKSGETAEEILNLPIKNPVKIMEENSPEENEIVEEEIVEEETANTEAEQPQEAESSNSSTTATTAGSYSGTATLTYIAEDTEAPDSLPVSIQLNEGGTGMANVNGFEGEANYGSNTVTFSVKMEEDGYVIICDFEGKVSKSGNRSVINGDMHFSMMGIKFATYSVSVQ